MTGRERRRVDWGVAIACLFAVPSMLAWTAITVVGGSLVCADEAAHCGGVLWPLVQGTALIVAIAAVVGMAINRLVAMVSRDR